MNKEYRLFLLLAFLAALIAIIAFDVFTRMTIRSEVLIEALNQAIHYSIVQPVGTLMLLAPFIVVGWVSAIASKDEQYWKGWSYFICGILALFYLYLNGHLDANYYLEQEQWTASALSVGLLPFSSVPTLLLAFSVGWGCTKVIKKWKT